MLAGIVGKEWNGFNGTSPLAGLNPFCTCTHYAIYANYAKNAVYIKYVLNPRW